MIASQSMYRKPLTAMVLSTFILGTTGTCWAQTVECKDPHDSWEVPNIYRLNVGARKITLQSAIPIDGQELPPGSYTTQRENTTLTFSHTVLRNYAVGGGSYKVQIEATLDRETGNNLTLATTKPGQEGYKYATYICRLVSE
jgi:hypothetical protein